MVFPSAASRRRCGKATTRLGEAALAALLAGSLPARQNAVPFQRCEIRRSLRPARNRRTDALRNRPKRSEEHTSELQSRGHLVCRLLLEKKKKKTKKNTQKKKKKNT